MNLKKLNKKLNFIDIFSGAGGLSCGLEMAGLNCLLGIDNDVHAIATFAKNHPNAKIFCGDVKNITFDLLSALVSGKEIHAIVGGPPCQGFSTVGIGDPNDKRNSLFLQFLRITKEVRPYFIIIENVTGLLAKKNEKSLKAIIRQFNLLGYNLDVQVLSSHHFGVPEIRRRTIILGTRINSSPLFPRPSHGIKKGNKLIPPITVGEALIDLKDLSGKIHNHDIELASIKNKIDLERLKRIPEGKGIRYKADEDNYLSKDLKLNVEWDKIREKRFRQMKYQRLDRKLPSPTIMTHRHGYYHPTEHRFLTAREAAKCQSFPNNFIFMGPLSAQWRQIGNAVPPLLGKALGKSLKKMFRLAELNSTKGNVPILKNILIKRKEAFHYKELT